MPANERDVATVHKRRGAAACPFLLRADEQVDGDAPRGVLLNILAVGACLASAVLTLPLELGRRDEVILVLKVGRMTGLVQRDQQKDVARALDKPDVPDRR